MPESRSLKIAAAKITLSDLSAISVSWSLEVLMDNANELGTPDKSMDMGPGGQVGLQIRTGCKREFNWIMKSQSEIGELPPSRKRVCRFQSLNDSSVGNDKRGRKKTGSSLEKARKFGNNLVSPRNSAVLEGADWNVVEIGTKVADDVTDAEALMTGSSDVGSGENGEVSNLGWELRPENVVVNDDYSNNLVETFCEMEMNPSEGIELTKVPVRLRDLLETGLLEGYPVRYIQGSRGRQRQESELEGIIQGTGILCSCDDCEGKTVVTPNQFELHARSGNKRPPEYIYLENGKSLRDVLNACKGVGLDSLKTVIQRAIGSPNGTMAMCLDCNAVVPEAADGISTFCASCFGTMVPARSSSQTSHSSQPSSAAGSSAPRSSASVSEVSKSGGNAPNARPKTKPQGKLTRKDLKMHKSVLDVLAEGAELGYYMHGMKLLTGFKTDGGIDCVCCNKTISPSTFEAHAGHASRRKPYMNIYTTDGFTLHQLSLQLSKIRGPSEDESDNLCTICEAGGILLCCEKCPRAFHYECVGLRNRPEGKWYCKYCQNMFEKEKLSGDDTNAIAAGLPPGVNLIEEITKRCTRIVGSIDSDIGECAICGGSEFSRSVFSDKTVIYCDQCEREYHIGCLREHKGIDLRELPEGDWYCGQICVNINVSLQKLIDVGEQKLPHSLLDVIKMKLENGGLHQTVNLNVSWRLLKGNTASADSRSWLSGAVSIFHDRFDPISDSTTRHVDMIPHMVYGRRTKYSDFFGMYCAVLMVESVVVCAGIFRIFGDEVAELPLVATRAEYQGKGYFQALYFCIENLLSSLNVKNLFLPAAEEAESLWTNKFGFVKPDPEKLKEFKRWYQMFMFEGTCVLHKSIPQG